MGVVCVGVLYHMTDPMEVLQLISRVTDTVIVWTHYYHPDNPRPLEKIDLPSPQVDVGGYSHAPQCYKYDSRREEFIGGQEPSFCLLKHDDILNGLRHFGLTQIDIFKESINTHPNG